MISRGKKNLSKKKKKSVLVIFVGFTYGMKNKIKYEGGSISTSILFYSILFYSRFSMLLCSALFPPPLSSLLGRISNQRNRQIRLSFSPAPFLQLNLQLRDLLPA